MLCADMIIEKSTEGIQREILKPIQNFTSLLPDTELAEDVGEKVVSGYRAGDFA